MSRPVILYFFLCHILVSCSDQFQTKFRRLILSNHFTLHVTKRPPVAQDCNQWGTFYLMTNDCIMTLYVKIATPTGFHGSARKAPVFTKSAPGNAKTFFLKSKDYLSFTSKVSRLYIPQGLDRGALTSSSKVGLPTSKFFSKLNVFSSTDLWPVTYPSHLPLRLTIVPQMFQVLSNLTILYIIFIIYYIFRLDPANKAS